MTKIFLLTYLSITEIHFPESIISSLLYNITVDEGFREI